MGRSRSVAAEAACRLVMAGLGAIVRARFASARDRGPALVTSKQRRAAMVAAILALVGGAAALVFAALRENITYFYGPSEIEQRLLDEGARFRLGGLVEMGSIMREPGAVVRFAVTDGRTSVPVRFAGPLPDLFREGQGVVTEGRFEAGVFVAERVLAKHDERYMPREVVDTLKRAGTWRGDGAPEEGAP